MAARGERPLSFIAQFDCRELQRFEAGAVLPHEGLLSFFYDAQEQPWGYDPADAGGARVLHDPASARFSRRTYPREIAAKVLHTYHPPELFQTKRLEFYEILTFPYHDLHHAANGWQDHGVPSTVRFAVEPGEVERAKALYEPGIGNCAHQIFGYPTEIQNPMELECQLVTHGVNTGNYYPPEAVMRWGAGAAAWRLLLQIDSADDMMWGDRASSTSGSPRTHCTLTISIARG
jgi:uncharacterized protein YwqG